MSLPSSSILTRTKPCLSKYLKAQIRYLVSLCCSVFLPHTMLGVRVLGEGQVGVEALLVLAATACEVSSQSFTAAGGWQKLLLCCELFHLACVFAVRIQPRDKRRAKNLHLCLPSSTSYVQARYSALQHWAACIKQRCLCCSITDARNVIVFEGTCKTWGPLQPWLSRCTAPQLWL